MGETARTDGGRQRRRLGLVSTLLVATAFVIIMAKGLSDFDRYLVTSYSMANTLLPGDMVVVRGSEPYDCSAARGSVARELPKRGEIWVYERQPGRGDVMVKRVIGLPGDTISMLTNIVMVNRIRLHEPYVSLGSGVDPSSRQFMWQREHLRPDIQLAEYRPTLGTWGPLIVPANAYFLLGDNRTASMDSRHHGFVRAEHMVARVVWIGFSYGIPDSDALPSQEVVRWDRIGRLR